MTTQSDQLAFVAGLSGIVSLALFGAQVSNGGVEPVSLGLMLLMGLQASICGLVALRRALRNPESRQRLPAVGFGLGTLMTILGIFLLIALLNSGE